MSTTTSLGAMSSRIADRIAQHVGPRKYAMWFDQSAQFSYDSEGRTLGVAVPNRFVADWIAKHFHSDLCRATAHETGHPMDDVNVNLHVDATRFSPSQRPGLAAPDPATVLARTIPRHRRTSTVKWRHQLDRFVVGPSNELAYAAAQQLTDEVLEDDTHLSSGPLFLHGGCGLGKTHLLQGICQRVLDRNPRARVHYATGEQFTNQYITAVRSNTLDTFRKMMRQLDLLAVDDIHFIANKNATQQEFLHSFDQIELGGARVVLASDSHPKLIKQFSEQLVSRCVRGLVVQIHPPNQALRLKLVEVLSQRRGMKLQPHVMETLAQHGDGSVREIEGLLTQLHAMASLNRSPAARDEPIGRALVDKLLQTQTPDSRQRRIGYSHIAQVVGDELLVSPAQIASRSRHRHIVLARSLVVHLARQLTTMSYPEIASAMGRKNHSTVITADQRIQKQLKRQEPILLPAGLGEIQPIDLMERLRRSILRP